MKVIVRCTKCNQEMMRSAEFKNAVCYQCKLESRRAYSKANSHKRYSVDKPIA